MTSVFGRRVWTIFRKDLRVWWNNKVNIAISALPVIGLLFIEGLFAVAVGRSPVALVTLDQGAQGKQMQQIFHQADVFRITDTSPQQAQELLRSLQVVAVITIPADFTPRVLAHQPTPIDVTVNNLNLDFTDDIRRAVPDVITQFYAAQGNADPVEVTIQEHDLRQRDVELFQYNVLPMLVLLLLMNGLVTNSIAAAREWESRTIKEMLLAPVARSEIITGKVLAGFVSTFALGILMLLLTTAVGWIQPEGIYWLTTLGIMALVALLSSGLGVAVGAVLQRVQPVSSVAILIALYLYLLAGGIGVLAFQPTWIQNLATYNPLTYGLHALEQAVFYSSSDLLGRDALVLSLSALAALGLGFFAMRREITN